MTELEERKTKDCRRENRRRRVEGTKKVWKESEAGWRGCLAGLRGKIQSDIDRELRLRGKRRAIAVEEAAYRREEQAVSRSSRRPSPTNNNPVVLPYFLYMAAVISQLLFPLVLISIILSVRRKNSVYSHSQYVSLFHHVTIRLNSLILPRKLGKLLFFDYRFYRYSISSGILVSL